MSKQTGKNIDNLFADDPELLAIFKRLEATKREELLVSKQNETKQHSISAKSKVTFVTSRNRVVGKQTGMNIDSLFADDSELLAIFRRLEATKGKELSVSKQKEIIKHSTSMKSTAMSTKDKVTSKRKGSLKSKEKIFLENAENKSHLFRKKKKKKQNRWYLIVSLCACLLIVSFSVFQLLKKPAGVDGNQTTGKYDAILSESEKQEWETKKAKPREVFIQLNTKIQVTEGKKIDIRLINPPYSRYRYQVELTIKEEKTPLYQNSIKPGTVLEFVDLNRTLEQGEYDAVVSYQFFDGDERLVGSKQVDVILSVK